MSDRDALGSRLPSLTLAACEMTCLVRDGEWDTIKNRLNGMGVRGKARDLFVVLAAMVPDDRPPAELLAWVDGSRAAMLRRAHAQAAAHKLRGEPVPPELAELDREWDRNRKRAAARRAA